MCSIISSSSEVCVAVYNWTIVNSLIEGNVVADDLLSTGVILTTDQWSISQRTNSDSVPNIQEVAATLVILKINSNILELLVRFW